MTKSIKVKLNKSNGQKNSDKYRVTANVRLKKPKSEPKFHANNIRYKPPNATKVLKTNVLMGHLLSKNS